MANKFSVGDRVYAKETIFTYYNEDYREPEALAGEPGEIQSVEDDTLYRVRFAEWVTLCHESELDFMQ